MGWRGAVLVLIQSFEMKKANSCTSKKIIHGIHITRPHKLKNTMPSTPKGIFRHWSGIAPWLGAARSRHKSGSQQHSQSEDSAPEARRLKA